LNLLEHWSARNAQVDLLKSNSEFFNSIAPLRPLPRANLTVSAGRKRPSKRRADQPATGSVDRTAELNYQDQFVLDPEGNDIEGVLRGGD
jgi:hypothetical protein